MNNGILECYNGMRICDVFEWKFIFLFFIIDVISLVSHEDFDEDG